MYTSIRGRRPSPEWTLFIYAALILCFPAAFAEKPPCPNQEGKGSFLWKIKRNPPAYFFGTIHVPYTRVWDHVPQSSKRAFTNSDNVYFELDLTNQETIASLARCQMLPGGTDLREVLPKDLYERLKDHLDYVKKAMPGWVTSEQEGRGLYADYLFDAIVRNWERKRPVWVMLMVNSLTEADIRTRGITVLDLHLAWQAKRQGKTIGAIEKVEEQCQPLNGLNTSQVLFALNHTLMMQEQVRFGSAMVSYTTDDLIDQYNCGDLNSIILESDSSQIPKLLNKSSLVTKSNNSFDGETNIEEEEMADNIDGYFKNELIYRRNERMAQRVKSLLENKPDESFFFAFGAGHFLGNGSVIDFLRKYGFEVEHSTGEEGKREPISYESFSDFFSPSIEWIEEVNEEEEEQRNHRKTAEEKNQHRRRGRRRRHKSKRGRRKSRRERNPKKFGELWMRIGEESSEPSKRVSYPPLPQQTYDGDDSSDQNSLAAVRVVNRQPTNNPSADETWMYDTWARFKRRNWARGSPMPHAEEYRTRRHHVSRKTEALSMEVWADDNYRRQHTGNAAGHVHGRSLGLELTMALLFFTLLQMLLGNPG